MAKPVTFWNRIANRYAKQPIADEAAYQKKLEVTRSYFRPEMEVLEFGCGTGLTAISHAPHVTHIQAIDISPKMLEIARARADEAQVNNVTFECATIESFEAPEASLDAVLGLSILHLLKDKEAAIAKVYQMLKPSGLFVSSTVCAHGTLKLMKLILPIGQFVRVE